MVDSNYIGDNDGHGTSVAGIIAESTPNNVSIMPINCSYQLRNEEKGIIEYSGTAFNTYIGSRYADEHGVDIINISRGRYFNTKSKISEYEDLQKKYAKLNALVVASSGNDGCDHDTTRHSPSSFPSVISVGAIDTEGQLASFSNYGTTLDFVAPGMDVTVADFSNNEGTRKNSGTSFAAPYIASVAAIIKASDTSLTNEEIVKKMIDMCVDLGEPGKDIYYGNGCPVFPTDISKSATVNLSQSTFTYTGKEIRPALTVRRNGLLLKENMDYTLSYSSNINEGVTAKVTITGKGIYTGTIVKYFKIIRDITKETITITGLPSIVYYTGNPRCPSFNAKIGGRNFNYNTTYKNNTNPGTATVTITGTGCYTGSISKTFKIVTIPLSQVTITLPTKSYVYTGSEIKPDITFKHDGVTKIISFSTLTPASAAYKNNTNVGTATVTITGHAPFAGSINRTFDITKASIYNTAISLSKISYVYSGNALKPGVTIKYNGKTLKNGTDYTIAYKNNTNQGTATVTITGKSNFTGNVNKAFKITKASINNTSVSLSKTSYVYTGNALKPGVTIKYNGKTLINGTDYTIAYKNNTNPGTATVMITGKGNFTGSVNKTYKITKASISNASITLPRSSYKYTGKAVKPAETVKYNGKTLINGRDYTVTYKNNVKVGTASVTITGKGNFAGSIDKSFKIIK